jgi:hypothetical protein
MFHPALASIQADREMETPRFPVFRDDERKRRDAERYRDATPFAAEPRSV